MLKLDHVAHCVECGRFGVKPLTGAEACRMIEAGFSSLESAFSLASDLDAGFTWEESIAALYRIRDQGLGR